MPIPQAAVISRATNKAVCCRFFIKTATSAAMRPVSATMAPPNTPMLSVRGISPAATMPMAMAHATGSSGLFVSRVFNLDGCDIGMVYVGRRSGAARYVERKDGDAEVFDVRQCVYASTQRGACCQHVVY